MKFMKKIVFLLVLAAIFQTANAQLINVDALAKIIKEQGVIVVDARPAADYLKTHIDGAIGLDVTSLCNATPVEGTLKPASELASILGKNGIAQNSKIVIYCKTGINAGRMFWIMKYLGCSDVSILDGQMDAWFAARKPITKNAKKLSPVTFSPTVNSSILVDKAYVKSKMNTAVLVDARKKEDYDAGHIGNAINISAESLINGSKLKAVADLTAAFSKVPKEKEIIVYCKSGVNAGFSYFVLKAILKYPNVKVYDGSYLDWKL
jgi:thiosulfate/3-mercaptopyruvate sulfurtransferase